MVKTKEPEVTVSRNFEVVDSGDDPLRRETVVTPPEEVTSIPTPTTPNSVFVAMYLGSAILDRRYPPQFVMPWVMAEVKRRKSLFHEVTLDVKEHVLRAQKFNSEGVLFEHKLICMTKFAKTHQDPRCFAYLSRQNLYCDYECHVFLAHDETMVSVAYEIYHYMHILVRLLGIYQYIRSSMRITLYSNLTKMNFKFCFFLIFDMTLCSSVTFKKPCS